MRKHLGFLLKTILLGSLSLLAFSLPLALILFFSHLHIIVILLIVNLAINSFTGILGILIDSPSTIISTAVIEIVLVLIIVGSDLLLISGLNYLLGSSIVLFILKMLYASLIKIDKENKFVWASYYKNEDNGVRQDRLVLSSVSG